MLGFAPSKIDNWKDIEEKREHLVPAPQPAQREPRQARPLEGNGRGIALFNGDGQFFARDTMRIRRGRP